jgi:hypothetical protein
MGADSHVECLYNLDFGREETGLEGSVEVYGVDVAWLHVEAKISGATLKGMQQTPHGLEAVRGPAQ